MLKKILLVSVLLVFIVSSSAYSRTVEMTDRELSKVYAQAMPESTKNLRKVISTEILLRPEFLDQVQELNAEINIRTANQTFRFIRQADRLD